MKVYLSEPEARDLCRGYIRASLVTKVRRQLDTPAPPMRGQTNLYDFLEDECGPLPATTD